MRISAILRDFRKISHHLIFWICQLGNLLWFSPDTGHCTIWNNILVSRIWHYSNIRPVAQWHSDIASILAVPHNTQSPLSIVTFRIKLSCYLRWNQCDVESGHRDLWEICSHFQVLVLRVNAIYIYLHVFEMHKLK